MPRRPIHLRWFYVRCNPARYAVLGLATVSLVIVALVWVGDPLGGLAAGAAATTGGWIGWKSTDRATYPDRTGAPISEEKKAA